jgi:hypothetical protein
VTPRHRQHSLPAAFPTLLPLLPFLPLLRLLLYLRIRSVKGVLYIDVRHGAPQPLDLRTSVHRQRGLAAGLRAVHLRTNEGYECGVMRAVLLVDGPQGVPSLRTSLAEGEDELDLGELTC